MTVFVVVAGFFDQQVDSVWQTEADASIRVQQLLDVNKHQVYSAGYVIRELEPES